MSRARAEGREGEQRDGEARRRRRDEIELVDGRRTGVPAHLVADKAYVYRRVNDDPGRVLDLWKRDWDVVMPDGSILDEPGFTNSGAHLRVVGTQASGEPTKMILMRKRRDWYEDDERAKAERTVKIESSMKAGMTPADQTGRVWRADDDFVDASGTIRRTLNR